jgi:uncharacterized damage-inducible protein DinB
MSIAEKLLPEFDSEFASTRKILALVPDDKLTWKPHEKSMALGRLAWHVSDFPSWCAETLKKDFLEFSPEDGPKMANEWKDKTREKILERFDADIKVAREALSSTSDEKWPQPWKMLWGGQAVIDEPRRDVYRRVVMNHMVHHRAQLGVYLRLNGIPIPGVYGPSADEM